MVFALCFYMNDNSFLVFYYIYLWPTTLATPMIYSMYFLVFNFLELIFLLYPPVLESALFKEVWISLKNTIWIFPTATFPNGWWWSKGRYIWFLICGVTQYKIWLLAVICTFSWVLGCILTFSVLARNFSVIKQTRDYFTLILHFFQLFLWL